jgi:NitT/TauT family transport system permease protein
MVPPVVVFGVFVVVWYLYSGLVLNESERNVSIPYFHDVVRVSFFDGANLKELLGSTWNTAWIAAIGLAIAIVLGVLFAMLMSQASWIERSFYPYAVLLQTIPILAIVPFIGLTVGFGIKARIVVVVIISLFPIITNTLFGIKSTQQAHHDLFTLHTASRWTRLLKLQMPTALPAIFTGFQISAGLAIIGEIVGGLFFGRGSKDLGLRIKNYAANLDVEQLIGAIVLSAALGIVVFWFFGYLRNRFTADWSEAGHT